MPRRPRRCRGTARIARAAPVSDETFAGAVPPVGRPSSIDPQHAHEVDQLARRSVAAHALGRLALSAGRWRPPRRSAGARLSAATCAYDVRLALGGDHDRRLQVVQYTDLARRRRRAAVQRARATSADEHRPRDADHHRPACASSGERLCRRRPRRADPRRASVRMVRRIIERSAAPCQGRPGSRCGGGPGARRGVRLGRQQGYGRAAASSCLRGGARSSRALMPGPARIPATCRWRARRWGRRARSPPQSVPARTRAQAAAATRAPSLETVWSTRPDGGASTYLVGAISSAARSCRCRQHPPAARSRVVRDDHVHVLHAASPRAASRRPAWATEVPQAHGVGQRVLLHGDQEASASA